MENSQKGSIIVYATKDERRRIKIAAAQLGISMSAFILECVMEQVDSIETSMKESER